MNIAHLKAYADAGISPAACFDLNRSVAETTAEKFGIPLVCNSVEELVSLTQVEIVDIAVHMSGRKEIFQNCCSAGKHILLQKPVAHTIEEASEFVALAQRAGVKYQVNQQARWAPTHQAVRSWMEMNAIGRTNFMRLEMRGWQDDPATWYVKQPNFTLVDHGVHYFDLLRFFAGRNARSVAAMTASVPGQTNVSPTIYAATVDFGDGLLAEHCFNNKVMSDPEWGMNLVIDGEKGSIFCDFETATLLRKDGNNATITPTKKWFPDAFLGPMADLMDAVSEDREPLSSGRDNVNTMRLVLGALESSNTGHIISVG